MPDFRPASGSGGERGAGLWNPASHGVAPRLGRRGRSIFCLHQTRPGPQTEVLFLLTASRLHSDKGAACRTGTAAISDRCWRETAIFILNRIPHISSLMVDGIDRVLDHAQTIVIGNKDPEFRQVPARMRDGQVMVDFVRIADRRSDNGNYGGICW